MDSTRFGGRRGRLAALITVVALALLLVIGQLGPSNMATDGSTETALGNATKSMVESGVVAVSPDSSFTGDPASGRTVATAPGFPPPTGESPATDALVNRDIIYTGSLQIRADDPAVQLRSATNVVKVAGGRIASSGTSREDKSRIAVVFRVPSAQYETVMEQLSELGEVESRTTATNDVTAAVADTEARLTNAKAAVERMRTLMAEAKTVGEVISVESQRTQRESEYEALKAQVESLQSAVQMATISMTIIGPEGVVDGTKPGFTDGLRTGWESVTDAVRNVLVAAGFLLPWLPLLGLLILGGWVVRRSYRRRATPVHDGGAA